MASSSPSSSHPPLRRKPRIIAPGWYQLNPPPPSNPSWTTFLIGLAASPSTSNKSLIELFSKHCVEHNLWDDPDLAQNDKNLPAFYAATEAISRDVCEKHPAAPESWVEHWVRALVMDSCYQKGVAFRDAGKEDPDFDDDVTPTDIRSVSNYEDLSDDGSNISRLLMAGKPKLDASEYQELIYNEPDWSALGGKGKEKEVTYDESEWLASGGKGKGKEKEPDPEYLQPLTYTPPPSKSKGKEKEKEIDLEYLQPRTYTPPPSSKSKGKEKEITPSEDDVSPTTKRPAHTREQRPSPTRSFLKSKTGGTAAIAVANKIEPQIEYVIEQASHWSAGIEEARKRAEQRVKDKIRQDREKEKQAQTEAQQRRFAGSSSRTPNRLDALVSTSSSTSASSRASSQATARGPHTKTNASARTRQPPSKPNKPPTSTATLTSHLDQSTTSVFSTSSDALPYTMTDKERREKTMRVRRQFPSSAMPRLVETEQALIKTRGNIEAAVITLGGTPKKNYAATPTPAARKNPLRRAGAVFGVIRSPEIDKRGPPSTSAPGGNQKGETPARGKAPESSLLTPPSTGANRRSSRPSLHQRIQNAAHSVGRRISRSRSTESSRRESSRSSSVPASPRSISLQEVLAALKAQRDSPSPPLDNRVSRYDQFLITKERAYRSGGDDEDAVNPLDGYKKMDSDLESEDEDEGERPNKEKKKDKAMDVTRLLREIQTSAGLTQLTEPDSDASDMKRWLDCSRLFRIDPSETSSRERVRLAGIRQPLFQYQAFCVYWQMTNSRRFGGGFVADMPGLGKTLIFLALIVAERQLALLWDEVHRSRAGRDGRHLPLTGQITGDVCPSQGKGQRLGWIACPCVFSNPTSQMPAQPGVRIAVVPASLMSNWRAEWTNNIDTSCHDLDMRLLLAHDGSVADRAEAHQMAGLAANVTALRANKVNKDPDSAKPGQERFLVLTTAQSYDAWIEKFKYGGSRSHVMVPVVSRLRTKIIWTAGFKYNIEFGIACADESHEDYNIDNGRAGVLARLPGNPMCWGYSGTPLEKSPRCLEGVLWALEKQARKIDMESLASGWAQSIEMKGFKREVFDKLCKDFDSCSKSGTTDMATLNDLRQRLLPFLTTFMIRRTPEVRWFGHPLVSLNSNLHRDIFLNHNDKYDEQIKTLKPEIEADAASRLKKVQDLWDKAPSTKRSLSRPISLGFNNRIHTQYKLRILATCPALIKLTTGENALTLKTDELRKWRGNNEKNSPYAKNLAEIFENSPKLLWLRDCILDMERRRDADGEEQKMIIITNFNVIAFILKLMIEHYIAFKKGRVGLMYAELRTPARSALLEAFTDAMTEDRNGAAVRRRKENIQFLIGTTHMLSKGLQLTRACNVVLMEPDHEFYRELQGYARVNRIGQRNPWTFSYRLIDDGSEVEKSILQRQKERGEFPGRPLKPGDVERMGPRDYGESLEESDGTDGNLNWTAPKTMSTTITPALKRMPKVDDLRGRALASK